MSRRVTQLAVLAAIVAAIWFGKPYFDQWQADRTRIAADRDRIAEERRDQIAEERRQASLAIVVPSGVREQWIQALDRAMDERLLIYKGRLRIRYIKNGYTYVPLANLQVYCDPWFGIQLTSSDAELAATLKLTGDLFGPEIESSVKESPAAGNLMDELCRRVLDRIASLNRDSKSSRPRITESD